jgi:glutamate-1-semialdehyde 2,1-aminomutase
MRNQETSNTLFQEAKSLMTGGVNSPVRAFKSVGGTPVFFKKGLGCRTIDEDDNEYIDFCCSWGPLILGHANADVLNAINRTVANGTSFGAPSRLENELARLVVDNHRYVEQIRFVSSGTEATMSAIRLARGYTGRDKMIKFDGCYHGHADGLLVKAGSGLVTLGTSDSAGVPESYAQQTVVLPLNDLAAVDQAFRDHPNDIACIIIEPIPANNGLLIQEAAYLAGLRDLCTKHGALLIFDEVISGFRVGFEGAAGYYGIHPDLLCFGKIIGGGLPVGGYAGSAKIMASIAPIGKVYQAGTLSGNPVAMAAGIAQLSACLQPGFYEELEEKTRRFSEAVNTACKAQNVPFYIKHIGSIFWMVFGEEKEIRSPDQIDKTGIDQFNAFYHRALDNGLYFGPSGYEVGFISQAHSKADLEEAAKRLMEVLQLSHA